MSEFHAWAAGFFDGEGSVGIYARTRRGSARVYEMRVIVTQKVPEPLDLLLREFGGYRMRPASGCEKWAASSRVAERFLRAIRPYSVVKAAQIDVALAFQERRIPHGQGSSHVQREAIDRNRELDEHDRLRLRELKAA